MKYIIIVLFILCTLIEVPAFSWNSCGSSTDPVKIVSLDVTSDKEQYLYVTGRAKVAINLTSPIKAKVNMYKKFFWGWSLLPCIDGMGSCLYDDLCTLSPYTNETCPPEFLNNGLPCTCPILQGQYAAKNFPINLNALPKWLESGSYKIKANISNGAEELLCIIINIAI